MDRPVLEDHQRERLKDLLPGKSTDCGVRAADNRLFIEAVLWIARTGALWRELPKSFGNWHRVYGRFNRWSKKGVWSRVLGALSSDREMEYMMVNGSIVRVHQHDAPKKRQKSEAVGKSCGGLSPRIHATVDALGNPLRFFLTEGQASEYGQFEALIKGYFADYVLTDKEYDSDRFVAAVRATKVVPSYQGGEQVSDKKL